MELEELLHRLEENGLECTFLYPTRLPLLNEKTVFVHLHGGLFLKVDGLQISVGSYRKILLWPIGRDKLACDISNQLNRGRSGYEENFDDFKEMLDVLKRMCA